MNKDEKRKRLQKLNEELDAAISNERLTISVDLVQGRQLLAVHRAGIKVLSDLSNKDPLVVRERIMFALINTAYHERADGLERMLGQFDEMVGNQVVNLAKTKVRDQLEEILGADLMDGILPKRRRRRR